MNNYKEMIAEALCEKIEGLENKEILDLIEVPQDEKMGDFAFPCFKLAKVLRKAPQMIAKDISFALNDVEIFEKVEAVNAYVNMFLDRGAFQQDIIKDILEKGSNFGRSDKGNNEKVIVEFSSPNIAKPFHIGHIRSTVIGNSIYKLYDFLGYDTVRINHLGDYGTQFGKMIVAYRLWGNKEDVEREPIKTLLGYYTKFHQEAEKNPQLDQDARDVFTKLEKGEKEEVELWQWFRDESLKEFNRVYDILGIDFDSYAGESFYSDKMAQVVKTMNDKGILEESKGAQIVDLNEYGMSPALITKSDGSTLYITRDIAAAVYRKNEYDFKKNIYVVASQQNLHFQQLFTVVKLMGYDWYKDCIHVPFGLVSLEDGTMSTREGRVVFLEDVLNGAVERTKKIIEEKAVATDNIDDVAKAVGVGAVIFQELSNNRIKDYVFSWDKVLNFEGETGPYVQYTHARGCSILRKAGQDDVDKALVMDNFKTEYLQSDSAYTLGKLLYNFPKVIEEAAEKYEPSILTRHIIRIAQSFNRFYHDERINVDNDAERHSKLALVICAKTVLDNGLKLLGMEAPEKM